MKYKRITSRNEEPFYAFNACKECEQKDGCDKWCAYTVGAYTRLHELEDKIEAGALVEVPKGTVVLTPEERTEEMRLANAERKEAVKEFAASVKLAFYYEFDELIPSTMADKIDELVEECAK